MAKEARDCMDCEHSVFCESWGEYKCLVKTMRIYEPENEAMNCSDFKKFRRKTALGDREKEKCKCKFCQAKVNEE